jgi:hypothetical protein
MTTRTDELNEARAGKRRKENGAESTAPSINFQFLKGSKV